MRIRTGNHWNNDSTDENFDSANRTDFRENNAAGNFPHSNRDTATVVTAATMSAAANFPVNLQNGAVANG
jgi:hypothetical protein